MANGDIAAAEAGFTPVIPGADFRLGYDDINRAADLAVVRGHRFPSTAAALAAIAAPKYGQLATRSDNKITYRWNGTKWCPWASGWIAFQPPLTNVNTGNNGGSSGRYRWQHGEVRQQQYILMGSSASFGGSVKIGTPEPVGVAANSEAGPTIGTVTVRDPSNGRLFEGRVLVDAPDATTVQLHVVQVTDAFGWMTPLVAGQPLSGAPQSMQIWADALYPSTNYPLS